VPFIFIDHGSTVNRPYHSVTPSSIKAVSKGAASAVVHHQDSPEQITEKQSSGSQHEQAIQQYQSSEQTHKPIKKVKRADEIMTSPVEVLDLERHSASDAWQKMQSLNIRHLPVVKNKKLTAMVCERDLLLHVMNSGHLPTKLDAILVKQVHAALPETDIHQLAHLMFDEHIGSLPIVNNEQNVLGIVTRYDILKVMSAYGPMEYWA